jgi:hypothetical protein
MQPAGKVKYVTIFIRPLPDGLIRPNFIYLREETLYMGKKVNIELLSIDKRIISRKLLAGELYEKDLQNLSKKLPDVSDNAEEVNPDDKEK